MNRFKRLREKTGLSKKAFCEEFKIPVRTVEDWEAGRRSPPEYTVKLLEIAVNALANEKERTTMTKRELIEKLLEMHDEYEKMSTEKAKETGKASTVFEVMQEFYEASRQLIAENGYTFEYIWNDYCEKRARKAGVKPN